MLPNRKDQEREIIGRSSTLILSIIDIKNISCTEIYTHANCLSEKDYLNEKNVLYMDCPRSNLVGYKRMKLEM